MTKQQRSDGRDLISASDKTTFYAVIGSLELALYHIAALEQQIESLQTTIRVMQDRLIAAQSR